MADEFSAAILRRCIAQLAMQEHSFVWAEGKALDILTDTLRHYLETFGELAASSARAGGRSEGGIADIFAAISSMPLDIKSVQGIKGAIATTQAQMNRKEESEELDVPRYPVENPAPRFSSSLVAKKDMPSHVNKFFPSFPEAHTLKSTEVPVSVRVRNARKLRLKELDMRRQAQISFAKLQRETSAARGQEGFQSEAARGLWPFEAQKRQKIDSSATAAAASEDTGVSAPSTGEPLPDELPTEDIELEDMTNDFKDDDTSFASLNPFFAPPSGSKPEGEWQGSLDGEFDLAGMESHKTSRRSRHAVDEFSLLGDGEIPLFQSTMSSMLIPGLEDGGLEIASLHKDRMPTGHGNEDPVVSQLLEGRYKESLEDGAPRKRPKIKSGHKKNKDAPSQNEGSEGNRPSSAQTASAASSAAAAPAAASRPPTG